MAFVALAIVASTAAGVAAERRWGARAERLSRRLIDLMHRYGLDLPLAANAIAWTTTIVVAAALVVAPMV